MKLLPPNADELVSAYLDGQAAPDEVALVESSPDLMERVNALRSLSNLLGGLLEAPPEQKETHISAALDAFDSLFSSTATVNQSTAPLSAALPPAATEASLAGPHFAKITSLRSAREQRRPRRFNSGIIAAAAAATLLFVALASFGLGGNDSLETADRANDTASSFSIASNDTADEASPDYAASDDAASDDAASDNVLIDPKSSAASTLAGPLRPVEALAEEAMSDEQDPAENIAESEKTEVGDATTIDPDSHELDSHSDESLDLVLTDSDAPVLLNADRFVYLGPFPSQKSLLLELEPLSNESLVKRAEPFESGLFPNCRQHGVLELANIETPTLIGQALVLGQVVEIHQITGDDDAITFLIVDATDCVVLPTTP